MADKNGNSSSNADDEMYGNGLIVEKMEKVEGGMEKVEGGYMLSGCRRQGKTALILQLLREHKELRGFVFTHTPSSYGN